jgi:hypothetical protein
MLHTVIEGPPGVGKTELGKILAEMYSALGVIKSNKFKLVKRTDLIGKYLGHTAEKTQSVIDDADGGVLFIDEAYSLGAQDGGDSFAKECIDTINQNLSENKKKFICIIAGYPDELEKSFFGYNPGLHRRFPFRYSIEGYSSKELSQIFVKKLNDANWRMDIDIKRLEKKEADKKKESKRLREEYKNRTKHESVKTVETIVETTVEITGVQEDDTSVVKSAEIKNEEALNFILKFFTENKDSFKNYGGDIDNLLVACKFCHSRRIFGKHIKHKRIFTEDDIENGFNKYTTNKKKEPENLTQKYMML